MKKHSFSPTLAIVLLMALALASAPSATATSSFVVRPSSTASVITVCSNDTQLRVAVLAGGTITFNCGVAAIPINGFMEVSETTVIDGASKITLNGGGISAFFQVFASANLTLRNLTLRNGRAAGRGRWRSSARPRWSG